MLRRLESVFKAETNFFEKFFFEFFVKFDGEHQSGAAPPVINIDQKVPRDIFICNIEKFELLA